jgi:hypothetical protein
MQRKTIRTIPKIKIKTKVGRMIFKKLGRRISFNISSTTSGFIVGKSVIHHTSNCHKFCRYSLKRSLENLNSQNLPRIVVNPILDLLNLLCAIILNLQTALRLHSEIPVSFCAIGSTESK